MNSNIIYRDMELSDIDLIRNLQNYGVSYLYTLYNNKKFDQEKLTKLQKLYVLNDDIFDNSLKHYFNQIAKNSDSYLWNNLVESEYISDNDIINIFGNLMEFLNKMDILNKTELIIKTFRNTIFHDRVIQLFFSNELGNISPMWEYICHPLFNSIKIGTYDWALHSNQVFDLIKEIIYGNGLLKEFMKWNIQLFNELTYRINISITDLDYDVGTSDYFLSNILVFMLNIWSDMNINVETDINYDYIIDTNCPIKWMRNSKNVIPTSYDLETELFFLILFNIRIGYIPVLYRAIYWEKSLEKLGKSFLNSVYGVYLKSKISEYIEMDKKIIGNNQLGVNIQMFYNNMIEFFVTHQDKTLDDIYSDFIFFYSNTFNKYDYKVSHKNLQFMIQFCKNDIYTKNTSLKYDFFKFIQLHIKNHKENIDIFPLDIILQHIDNFVLIHNKITNSDSVYDYDLNSKLFIYESFLFYFKEFDYLFISEQLIDIITKDNIEFKKFINTICMDLNEYSETLGLLFDEIKEKPSRKIINSNIDSINVVLTRYIKIMTLIGCIITESLKHDNNKNLILSKEILTTIILSIKIVIKIFHKITTDPRILLIVDDVDFKNKVTYIIIQLFNQNIDLNYFIDDNDFELKNYQMLKTDNTASCWNNFISEIREYIESYQGDIEEVPDEFLDSLTYCPIEEPCLLPNTSGELANTFFDRITISKQLLIKEENPFTGDQLTTKEFEEYNSLEEIKAKNEDFRTRFMEWKNKSIKKK